jgi:multidrug efflux pump subunit AcrA (membrane-fusion protein)
VPDKALRIEGTRRKLYVIKDGRLEERLVEVGESRDGWIEIRQGLADGEYVMLNPGTEAADGAPVILQP